MTTDDPPPTPALADTAVDVTDSATTTARTERVSSSALGGYVLADVIGRGGMGEVVAAHDQRLEREVAIKRMRDAHPDREAIARFVREAKIQARLDHPAIVPVHELGTDEAGLPYFTMKRLAGTTLADRLKHGGKLQPLLRAFVDACFAIELAHTRGVVHRDLKPANIMLGDYGDVYVLDWGVARLVGTAPAPSLHLPLDSLPPNETATGTLLGTPGYMAPEQMRGEAVGTAADIYALGAILFEILAGEALHPPGNAAFASTLSDQPTSPAARRPDRAIAPELDRACAEALAPDPAARPTARALAERVQRYLDGDRDLEQRRRLADEHLAAARAALAGGDRAEAIYRGGRALALDPESADAAELVMSLIVEPPEVLPPEIEAELEAAEVKLDQIRARRGAWSYLMIWLLVPLFPLLHVASWGSLIALFAVITTMSVIALIDARHEGMPLWLVLFGNLAVVTLFSRVAGPFVLSPLLACGVALAVGTQRQLADKAWVSIVWLVVAIVLPIVLEVVGVLDRTWDMVPEGLVSHGTIFDGRSATDALGITIGTVALAIVVGLYTLSMSSARRLAQRESHIQAWHLGKLLPKKRLQQSASL